MLLSTLGLGTATSGRDPLPSLPFPPYHSTDAETADRWTLEGRLGLVRFKHEAQQDSYSSPLLRFNFGLPENVEILSEFEYRIDEERVADAAIGFKWIPIMRSLSVGVETLVLLPVSHDGGTGIESLLLATLRAASFRLHVNAGGFHDGRPEAAETGWKGGVIAELRLARFRPGVELFAKHVRSEPVQVLSGPGLIVNTGTVDFRTGVHLGLSRAAPDVTASVWITTRVPLR